MKTQTEDVKKSNSSYLRSSNSPAKSAKKDDRDIELRSESPGYSSIQTCLCIKMDFCDFTLEHFLDSLRTNRQLFPDVTSLFNNISSFVDFKPEKSNQKFGAFSPLYIICQLLDWPHLHPQPGYRPQRPETCKHLHHAGRHNPGIPHFLTWNPLFIRMDRWRSATSVSPSTSLRSAVLECLTLQAQGWLKSCNHLGDVEATQLDWGSAAPLTAQLSLLIHG